MSRQAKGAKSNLILAFETNYGETPAVPVAVKLPFNTNNLAGKQGLVESNTITGRRDPTEPGRGQIDPGGNIVVPLDVRGIGYWLTLMFGEPTTTGAGPYTHVWKIVDTMPSASIEKGFTDIGSYGLYPGCKISKWGLSVAVGNNELTTNFDIMAADESVAADSFAEDPTEVTLTRFNNFQAAVMEGGVSSATCRKFDLNVDFGLDGDSFCLNGEGTRTDIAEGIVPITGSIETLFKDAALLDKAINGTESSLKITFTNGAHSLEISLPEVIFERSGTPPIDGPKGLLLTAPFRAYYKDHADDTAIKVTLINDVAEYALPA